MGEAGKSLLHDAAAGFIAGVTATAALWLVTFLAQDRIAGFLSRPTCVQPTGLVEVPPSKIGAAGPAQEDGDRSYPPANVLDAYLGTLWVPPLREESWGSHRAMYRPGEEDRTLTLRLPNDVDVELVCVNNGLAYSTTPYKNFGRARTVRTWIDESTDDAVTTTLASQASDDMQQLQEVGRGLGDAKRLYIRIDDAHPGETVETFDPNACGEPSEERRVGREVVQLRYERGCIAIASPYAGLSDVVVYQEP
jgi:hypothetical protein